MPPKAAQSSELSRTCAHPACCSHEAAEPEATSGPPAGTLPNRPETKGAALWGSLKSYALWFLVFFGIYASSSVCVFCGTPGCPVGAGAAGIMGAFFAAMWTYGRALLDLLKEFIGLLGRFRRDRHVTGPD